MTRADREDLALAAAVLVVVQVDAWGPGLFEPNMVGPPWLLSVAHGVMAASLALRRRAPFVTFAVVAGTALALALTVGASEGLSTLVPALVAVYSVASHGTRPQAMAAAGLTGVLVLARELNNPDNTTWAETANAFAWNLTLAAAWLLGSWLRARRLYEAELAERLRQAEQERAERERLAAARAAEEERARIARELHDVVAHGVSVMVLQADAAEAVLQRDPEGALARLQNIQRTGRESLSELRRVLGTMQSPREEPLAPQPGLAHLQALLDRVREAGLQAELDVEGTPVRLPPGVDLAAYRVVQESLTNVLKHAHGASSAHVRLSYRPGRLDIEVHDDGDRALSPALAPAPVTDGTGHGLVGMRERVALYGGVLEAGRTAPDSGRGFRVQARLPVETTP